MATRRDIIDAVYDELVTAVATDHTVTYDDGSTVTMTLTAADVNRLHPETLENVNAVYFNPSESRHREFNGVGNGPDHVEYDANGNVEYSLWAEYTDLLFSIYARGEDPPHEEPIYEAVRRRFARYTDGRLEDYQLASDVEDIELVSSFGANTTEADDAIFGDQLDISVTFRRNFILESGGSMTMDEAVAAIENIAGVNLEIDADTDSQTTGFTYTVT